MVHLSDDITFSEKSQSLFYVSFPENKCFPDLNYTALSRKPYILHKRNIKSFLVNMHLCKIH